MVFDDTMSDYETFERQLRNSKGKVTTADCTFEDSKVRDVVTMLEAKVKPLFQQRKRNDTQRLITVATDVMAQLKALKTTIDAAYESSAASKFDPSRDECKDCSNNKGNDDDSIGISVNDSYAATTTTKMMRMRMATIRLSLPTDCFCYCETSSYACSRQTLNKNHLRTTAEEFSQRFGTSKT